MHNEHRFKSCSFFLRFAENSYQRQMEDIFDERDSSLPLSRVPSREIQVPHLTLHEESFVAFVLFFK